MPFSNKVIFETSISPALKLDSVLAISGIYPCTLKPHITFVVGKGWAKTANNGRVYYKFQLDCFKTSKGKALYAKAWSRKLEPDTFDVYAEEDDLPVTDICPIIGPPVNEQ